MRVYKIPEYLMQVQFHDRSIHLYDEVLDEVIVSATTDHEIEKIERNDYNTFYYWESGDKRHIVIAELLHKESKLKTNAGYILSLQLDTPTHGFYFGTYEIGEFSLVNDTELVLEHSYPIEYCGRGVIGDSGILYIGLREGGGGTDKPPSYFLAKLNWNLKDNPIAWKKPIHTAIMSIIKVENHLILGFKDGSFQIWDLEQEECIRKEKIFESTVTVIKPCSDKVILSSRKGDIAGITKEGDLIWKSKPSNRELCGIFEDVNGINIIDTGGMLYQLNSESGELLNNLQWKFGNNQGSIASNLIRFRDWIFAAGGNGIWGHYSEDQNKVFHISYDDLLIRKLGEQTLGFYSGDDGGYIHYWKIGGLIVRNW